jgi:hypothetical protein
MEVGEMFLNTQVHIGDVVPFYEITRDLVIFKFVDPKDPTESGRYFLKNPDGNAQVLERHGSEWVATPIARVIEDVFQKAEVVAVGTIQWEES